MAAGFGSAILVATALVSAPAVSASPVGSQQSGSADWPVYHQDALGSGVDPSADSFADTGPLWTSVPLDGQLYGEPLEEDGLVIVATENDTVYALSATTGSIVWQTHLATPVPAGDLPCGDISPTVGITSTPVIDPTLGEVFVVADELTGTGDASHHLVGLNLSTGAVQLDQAVDPPGSFPLFQLQRPGLALDDGQVIIGFGGNAGDCESSSAPYHGWVVAVPESGGPMTTFEVASAPGDSQGAIWMGGAAPEVDGSGNIWLSTGNSAFESAGDTYDDSDGVLELSPSLRLEQVFAPSDWYRDNARDYDLGSSVPALLQDGQVFQAGKSHFGYLLSQSALGGVGGQLASMANYCAGDDDGGNAVVGTVVYSPCLNGVVATELGTSPPSISVLWRAPTSGGSPIVAGNLVWTINYQNGFLYALNPDTGQAEQTFSLGAIATHFPTPSVGDGLLFAPSADQVHAFAGGLGSPNNPGSFVLRKSSDLIGNEANSVSGTGWDDNGDTSVQFYECATTTWSASSCTGALATATVDQAPPSKAGDLPATPLSVPVGTIDADGDTCGVAGSGPCYVVAVGSSGDSTSDTVTFSTPSVKLAKTTAVLGNAADVVTARNFPIGATVTVLQCEADVDPATETGSACDPGTAVNGTAGSTGTVVFPGGGVTIHVGTDYQDSDGGTCAPGATCDVVAVDDGDPAASAVAPVGLASPTLTVSPAMVPDRDGETLAVTGRGFPIGETVSAVECDTAFSPGGAGHCDTATQIEGVANSSGEVTATAWTPVEKIPVLTASTSPPYSDSAGGTCAAGDTVASGSPCYVGASDVDNAGVAASTPFSVS